MWFLNCAQFLSIYSISGIFLCWFYSHVLNVPCCEGTKILLKIILKRKYLQINKHQTDIVHCWNMNTLKKTPKYTDINKAHPMCCGLNKVNHTWKMWKDSEFFCALRCIRRTGPNIVAAGDHSRRGRCRSIGAGTNNSATASQEFRFVQQLVRCKAVGRLNN